MLVIKRLHAYNQKSYLQFYLIHELTTLFYTLEINDFKYSNK